MIKTLDYLSFYHRLNKNKCEEGGIWSIKIENIGFLYVVKDKLGFVLYFRLKLNKDKIIIINI